MSPMRAQSTAHCPGPLLWAANAVHFVLRVLARSSHWCISSLSRVCDKPAATAVQHARVLAVNLLSCRLETSEST